MRIIDMKAPLQDNAFGYQIESSKKWSPVAIVTSCPFSLRPHTRSYAFPSSMKCTNYNKFEKGLKQYEIRQQDKAAPRPQSNSQIDTETWAPLSFPKFIYGMQNEKW